MTCVAGVSLAVSVTMEFNTVAAREYLRVGDGLETTISDRQVYWERGLERVAISNLLGSGPLDKFQGATISDPAYVAERNAHNTFLSVVQYYGVPGGALYVLFLILLLQTFLRRRDNLSVLGLSLLAFGLVQSVSENWLLSFGTPSDLYSWLILGLACASRAGPGRISHGRHLTRYLGFRSYAFSMLRQA